MRRDHLVPKQIVDRNGKRTTVRVRPTSGAGLKGFVAPVRAASAPNAPMKTHPDLDGLIDEFTGMQVVGLRGKRYPVSDLADPDLATDRCASATSDFHQHLRRNRPKGPAGFVLGARILTVHWEDGGAWHRTNLVDGYVIDWTARQFDPTVPWPLVEPVQDYLERCSKAQDFHEPDVPLLPPEVAPTAIERLDGYMPEGQEGATALLQNGKGNIIEVTLGDFDENAVEVYREGQCLALAIALAERSGHPVVLHTFPDVEISEGQQVSYDAIKHAMVRIDDQYVDISGYHDVEAYAEELEPGQALREVPAQQARDLLEEYEQRMSPQDVKAADSFAREMLSED